MNLKTLVVASALLGSANAYGQQVNPYDLGFSAPVIQDKSTLTNSVVGEIVYDLADKTFYGFAGGTSWKRLSENNSAVRATRSASAQTITASGAIVYNSEFYDQNNAFDISTGKYTCPSAGLYRVSGNFKFDNLDAATNAYIEVHYDTGAISQTYGAVLGGTSSSQAGTFIETVNCAANKDIWIVASGDASFTVDSSNTRNRISIERIGDN